MSASKTSVINGSSVSINSTAGAIKVKAQGRSRKVRVTSNRPKFEKVVTIQKTIDGEVWTKTKTMTRADLLVIEPLMTIEVNGKGETVSTFAFDPTSNRTLKAQMIISPKTNDIRVSVLGELGILVPTREFKCEGTQDHTAELAKAVKLILGYFDTYSEAKKLPYVCVIG